MTKSHSHIHYPRPNKGFSRKIDVRSKIIATIIVVLICSIIVELTQLIWFFLVFLFFLIILKPNKDFIKFSLPTIPIIVSLSLIAFFSFSRSPIVYKSLFYWTIHDNISFALFTGLRSYLIALFVLMMINSEESFFEIIYGLDDLKMPTLITNLTFFTFRFFFLMQEEFGRILEARSNRLYGEKLRFNLKSLKVIGNIIGSALARSFKRAENVSATLSARGFSGKLSHPEQPWTFKGIIFLIFTFLFIVTIIIIDQTFPIAFLEEIL
ncbi:MAG: energy-coupling factor transporter transmembrane component T family protein [Candidatus Hermodarchaeota archaeon]